MTNNHEQTFVPKLRFPEFEDSGEWNVDKVGNIISTISPPKKLNSKDYIKSGRFPIVDQSQKFYCGWTNDNTALIEESFPLIIFGNHTCILKLVNEPFAQGADGIKIFKPKSSVATDYLYQYLNYNGVHQEDYKRHFSILKDKIVIFPDIEAGEQQKIAACLSSLDDLISAENHKLDALTAHKKGLLQHL
ncbi:MAG: restriction endonuclease subunit S, partial [Candidatus Kapabacteria bacterium]|nr:restriction endonuclease subunit S [Candidatus Kapabacteria bacterium]